jgi:hypothetical protein
MCATADYPPVTTVISTHLMVPSNRANDIDAKNGNKNTKMPIFSLLACAKESRESLPPPGSLSGRIDPNHDLTTVASSWCVGMIVTHDSQMAHASIDQQTYSCPTARQDQSHFAIQRREAQLC